MSTRSALRKNIQKAWALTINEAYTNQLINSEHGLQAYLFSYLRKQFDKNKNRSIFVEPSFQNSEGRIRIPDLVICNRQRIIGVIELKYQPRSLLRYEKGVRKDIETLAWFANSKENYELENSRYLGQNNSATKAFALAQDALLCWAGVYRGGPSPIENEATRRLLGGRLLCLHAVTKHDDQPTVKSNVLARVPRQSD